MGTFFLPFTASVVAHMVFCGLRVTQFGQRINNKVTMRKVVVMNLYLLITVIMTEIELEFDMNFYRFYEALCCGKSRVRSALICCTSK